jgi:hypothetical protein
MIKELILQHFQSHKKTLLQFSPGINSIVGISDSGKTALLRGLNWAINNRPLGLSYVSHWNRDKDGEPVKSTFIKVTNDKGIIERRKGKVKINDESRKFNGYILNDDSRLEAVGTSVPDEVNRMFNLDEVNFQGQFDPSFLLSNSAGEVARFFNSTIRLDLIDRILSKADSKRLEVNKEKKRLEIENAELEKEIKSFAWLEEAEILVSKIEKIDSRVDKNENIVERLSESVDNFNESQSIIDKQGIILSAVPIINRINILQESLEEKIEKCERLQNLYDDYVEQNRIIGTADFSSAEKIIMQIEMLNNRIENKEKIVEKLSDSLEEYKIKYVEKEQCLIKIIELEKELPSLCPLCNKPLKEDKCK